MIVWSDISANGKLPLVSMIGRFKEEFFLDNSYLKEGGTQIWSNYFISRIMCLSTLCVNPRLRDLSPAKGHDFNALKMRMDS